MKPKGRQGTVLSSFSRSFGLIIPRKKQLGNAKIFSDPSIPLSSHLLRNLGARFLQGGASCNIPNVGTEEYGEEYDYYLEEDRVGFSSSDLTGTTGYEYPPGHYFVDHAEDDYIE
nr:uncharacterized protein LOC127300929 isoform X1 [Lolium perenne]